jgi:hypothetical protein
MIETFNYSLLPNDELYTFTQRVMTACNGLNLTDASPLKPLVIATGTAFEKFDLAFKRESKNSYTAVFRSKDEIRDEAFLAMRYYAEAWTHRADAAKKEAALKIVNVIRRYDWSANSLGDKAETAALSNIENDLRANCAAELALLNFAEWLDEMSVAQKSFEESVSESAANTPTDQPTLTATRPVLIKSLKNLFSLITLLEPTMTELTPLIPNINALISQSLSSAKAAATRAANQKAEEAKKTEGQ